MQSSPDDEKFELFCEGCATRRVTGCKVHISDADLYGNAITFKGIQSFVNMPPHILQDLRVLNSNKNQLDRSACDLLAKVIPSLFMLEEIRLSNNPIESGGAVEVIKALYGTGVKQLFLHRAGIGVKDSDALCELLKSSNSVQTISISQNKLSSESLASIITGLKHNNSLTYMNISDSHFSMTNVVSLASVFKDHSKSTLTKLNLQCCHISIDGAVKLAAALCKNSTLKHLYLDRNPIGVEGAFSTSDMLQHNTSLEILTLCDDSVGEKGIHQLINSLKHNQTLNALWLPWKYMSETNEDRISWRRQCNQSTVSLTMLGVSLFY